MYGAAIMIFQSGMYRNNYIFYKMNGGQICFGR